MIPFKNLPFFKQCNCCYFFYYFISVNTVFQNTYSAETQLQIQHIQNLFLLQIFSEFCPLSKQLFQTDLQRLSAKLRTKYGFPVAISNLGFDENMYSFEIMHNYTVDAKWKTIFWENIILKVCTAWLDIDQSYERTHRKIIFQQKYSKKPSYWMLKTVAGYPMPYVTHVQTVWFYT